MSEPSCSAHVYVVNDGRRIVKSLLLGIRSFPPFPPLVILTYGFDNLARNVPFPRVKGRFLFFVVNIHISKLYITSGVLIVHTLRRCV